eukprot:TRINITY_DN761_c0_g1_i1.p1 TRINITY_DN761_c0_g1~~TRINITY_DN761_c0_g1_i1.p1  ORF type:complete len:843 (+),score=109.54 TRINITY_DN761_c0_g1_i1:577-3105(+)
MWRPRARALRAAAAHEKDGYPGKPVAVMRPNIPLPLKFDSLTLDFGANGYVRHCLSSLGDVISCQPNAELDDGEQREINIHMTHEIAEVVAREIFITVIGLYLHMFRNSPIANSSCIHRLEALLVLSESSLGIPPYFAELQQDLLDSLIACSTCCATFNAVEFQIADSIDIFVPNIFRFSREEDLRAVREVWRVWRQGRYQVTKVLFALGHATDHPHGASRMELLAGGTLASGGIGGTGADIDIYYTYRKELPPEEFPPPLADIHSKLAGHADKQTEIAYWARFLSLNLPTTEVMEMCNCVPPPASLLDGLQAYGQGQAATGRRVCQPLRLSRLFEPSCSFPSRITDWAGNPLFLRLYPASTFELQPADPPLWSCPASPFDFLFDQENYGQLRSVYHALLENAQRYLRFFESTLDTAHTTLHVYVGNPLETACWLASFNELPGKNSVISSEKVQLELGVSLTTGSPAPALDAEAEAPPKAMFSFDMIDSINTVDDVSLTSLLLVLQPMLKPCPQSYIVTKHPAVEAGSSRQDYLRHFENLIGATEEVLHSIYGLNPSLAADDEVVRWCWHPAQSDTQTIERSEGFRSYFWKLLQSVLLPRQYRPEDPTTPIAARDYPSLETTATFIGVFDTVHRWHKLPGPGIVESIIDDSLGANISTLHVKAAMQTVCRQYFGQLHEDVIGSPAVHLPLSPICTYTATVRTARNLTTLTSHHLDTVPLSLLIVSPLAQTEGWLTQRGEVVAKWLVDNKGAVQVVDNLDVVVIEPASVTLQFSFIDDAVRGSGKVVVLLHWETAVFLSECLPVELLVRTGSKSAKKKKKKKKSEKANKMSEDNEAEDSGDEG